MRGVADLVEAVKDDICVCASDSVPDGEIAWHREIDSKLVQKQSAGFDEGQAAITIGAAATEDELAVILFFRAGRPLQDATEVKK